jgi:hypothetical protein
MYNRIEGFLEVNKAGEHPAIFIIAVFINYGLQDKVKLLKLRLIQPLKR